MSGASEKEEFAVPQDDCTDDGLIVHGSFAGVLSFAGIGSGSLGGWPKRKVRASL